MANKVILAAQSAPSADVRVFTFHLPSGATFDVRTVVIDGDPWFVGRDVCDALGYARHNDAMQQHCKGAAIHHPLPTSGGAQQFRIIPERDLYRLVMRSKLESAQEFEEWVVGDVLPSLRKTGSYAMQAQQAPSLPTDYAQALRALACEVEEKERIAAEKARADAELTTARPKAVACDVLSESKGDRCIRTAAKDLKVQERRLIAKMIEKGWLFRTHRPDGGTGELQPTARIAKLGFAKMVPVHTDAEKTKTRDSLRITNAGLTRLAALAIKWGLSVSTETAVEVAA